MNQELLMLVLIIVLFMLSFHLLAYIIKIIIWYVKDGVEEPSGTVYFGIVFWLSLVTWMIYYFNKFPI